MSREIPKGIHQAFPLRKGAIPRQAERIETRGKNGPSCALRPRKRVASWPGCYRGIALLLFALLTAGCAPTGGGFFHPQPSAQSLFRKGLDQVAAGKRTRAFSQLEREYPASPWTAHAHTVLALKKKVREQARALAALQEAKSRCALENARLTKETDRYRNDLEKLKKLLIENELRPQ